MHKFLGNKVDYPVNCFLNKHNDMLNVIDDIGKYLENMFDTNLINLNLLEGGVNWSTLFFEVNINQEINRETYFKKTNEFYDHILNTYDKDIYSKINLIVNVI